MASPQPLQLLCVFLAVSADPLPGRVPKVYNALITSNQNLEPSKAYPVYQPVLHDFGFPYQPSVFYGDYPVGNGLQPIPAAPRKDQNEAPPPPPAAASAPQNPEDVKPSAESSPASPEPSDIPQEGPQGGDKPTPAPPLPPNTESPIPLNQFGLPPQVLPLGRFNPAYNGFNQIGPFTYSYPSVQFYDPYDPFSLNPYVNFPSLYRPLPNILEARPPGIPVEAPKEVRIPASPVEAPVQSQSGQSPPPEPNDLNVLNYSSKDPAIPNVPPPPLPQGGLKSDGTE